MWFNDLLIALGFALLLAIVLAQVQRRRSQVDGPVFLFLLVVLFPLVWLGGAWIGPVGPPLGQVSWLGFLGVGLLLALLVLAVTWPPHRPPTDPAPSRSSPVIPENADRDALVGTAVSFGIFFWILLVAVVALLVLHYADATPGPALEPGL